jgi:hypothetical protein
MRVFLAFGIIGLAFLTLLAGAIAWDVQRELRNVYRLVLESDREVRDQEVRFISNLPPIGIRPQDFQAEIARFQQASGTSEREAAFQELILAIGQLKPTASGDPIARRAADEFAGALNRRQIARRCYQEAANRYNETSKGLKGNLARRLTGLPEEISGQ